MPFSVSIQRALLFVYPTCPSLFNFLCESLQKTRRPLIFFLCFVVLVVVLLVLVLLLLLVVVVVCAACQACCLGWVVLLFSMPCVAV